MNKLYAQFIRSALKRRYTEDDAHEALRIVMSRQGVEFLEGDAALVMTYLIRALSEARTNNSEAKRKVNYPEPHLMVDAEDEWHQPSACPPDNRPERLDKVIKHAKLPHYQLQLVTLVMKGYSNLQIAEILGSHHNSIGKYIKGLTRQLVEVNKTTWA